VSEIRTKSDPETKWFWILGELNIADMGTRPTVLPEDMGPGTLYQEELPWMREPPEVWPTKKTFTSPPPEECKKDMLAMVKVARVRSGLWYPPSADMRAKLERVYVYMYTFLARVRKLGNFTPIAVGTKGDRQGDRDDPRTPSGAVQRSGQTVRTPGRSNEHSKGRVGRSDGPETRMYDVEGFAEKKIITLGGRQKNYLRVNYQRSPAHLAGSPPLVQIIPGRDPQDGPHGC
jgi:hypothetical protein